VDSTEEAVNTLKNEALKLVKEQLKELLTSASKDADSVIKGVGEKVAKWLVMRAKGELNDRELEALLYSQDQALRQYKNTTQIKIGARVEKISVALINLVLDKILGLPFE